MIQLSVDNHTRCGLEDFRVMTQRSRQGRLLETGLYSTSSDPGTQPAVIARRFDGDAKPVYFAFPRLDVKVRHDRNRRR
jgi:hypothetical protein